MSVRDLEIRRDLLVARCALARLQLAQSAYEVRTILHPPPPTGFAAARSRAAIVLRFALPLLGTSRAARFVRALSWGLIAVRAVAAWRAR